MRKIYLPAKQFKTLFLFFSFLLFAFWASAGTYYLTAAGAGNAQTPASWNTLPAGGGTAAANFTTNGDIFNIPVGINGIFGANTIFGSGASSGSGVTIQVLGSMTINNGFTITFNGKGGNNSSITITGSIIFGATSKVSLNDNDIRNSFVLLASATLKTANVLGVVGTNCSVEKTAGLNPTVTLTNGANYEFNGTAPQATLGLPTTAATINTLTINNAAGVSLSAAVTVSTLTIGNVTAGSILNDNGKQITSAGTINMSNAATFNVGTAAINTSFPAFGGNTIQAGTTVNYNSSTASQTIAAVNYGNLTNTGGGIRSLAASGTIGIKGNFSPGAGAYTVNTSTVSFNGTAAQVIPAITFSFYNLIITNAAGISSIGGNTTITSSLALTNGVVTTGANKIIIPIGASVTRTNGWVNGNLQQYIPIGGTSTFFVGDGTVTGYRPVLINFAAGSTAGDLTVVQLAGFHPQIASSGLDNTTPKAITPYWNLIASGGLAGTYDATFTFVAGDVPGAATTSNFIIRKYSASWATTIAGIKTATSTQATGLTSFGDFCIGETFAIPTVSTQPVSTAVCLGNNISFTSASTSIPTTTVQWQRSTDGTTWVNIIATTDGSKYTNFTTNTLTITGPDFTMNGYQYRSVYTNINGSVNSTAVTLTVTKIPTITTLNYAGSPFADITATPQSVTLAGTNTYTGGTYTSDAGLTINSTTGAITPNTSTLGNHTITYTIAAAGGCGLVSATTVINITSAPTANIAYPANSYCISDISTHPATLTGTGNFNNGSAGFYSVSPGTGLVINASGDITSYSAAGTYTITYHIPATTSPTFPASTSDKVIIITPIPTATITYTAGPFCTSDQTAKTVTLNGTGAFSNGVFSASPSGLVLNATTGQFTPNASTVNTYTITYTIPASGGCAAVPVTATAFNIVAAPTASITYNGGKPYCQAITTPQAVTLVGASGGSFSFTPAGLTIDAAGAITPSTSIAGDYVVTYTIPASGPCGIVQITTPVTISETPTGNISYTLQPYCTSDPAKLVSFITPTGLYAGGVFSSTPGGLTINASTGTITPASSTPNSYTVNYNTPNGCPVIFTTPVQVDGSPTATISYAGTPFCIADGSSKPVTLGGTGTFTGGNYSSTIGLSIDGVNGNITPSTSTAGTYIVTYTIIPASPNCAAITTTTSVTITPAVGVPTAITISGGAEPTCQLTNGSTTTTYASTVTNSTGFNWSLSNGAAGSISAAGVMTWANGFFGSVDIQVTANGCNGLSAQVIRTVNITPSVTTPVFTLGATSTRCQGAGIVTYDAAATNITGITYTLDATSLGGGNSIISTTGNVAFAAGWSGTSAITASAAGCNGPLSATHTVTITATVGTPVFSLGATSIRCQGGGTLTYTATATNTTGITYTLDATTAAFVGNSIVSTTGAVTYAAGWSGTSTITASAAGCNGPKTSIHTVTITPTVIINAFSPATSTRCQAAGSVTTTTTASNSTGITYSLDATTAAFVGNSINASTGAVTYAAGWSGTTTITASAAGCNGPATTTLVVTNNGTSFGGTLSPSISSPLTVCAGANSGTITLTSKIGTVTQWEQSINGGSSWTNIGNSNNVTLNYTNLTQTTLYRVLVTNGTCTGVYSALGELVVLPAFTPVITSSATATCIGVPITLTASGYSSSGLVIANGDFPNPSPGGWTGMSGNASNNSTGNPVNAIWGITNNSGSFNGVTYVSTPSNNKFMIVNGAVSSILVTPVFSTVGMSSAVLAFNEGYNFSAGTVATIEISTTGLGGPWTILKNYTVPVGATTTNPLGFAAGIDLNTYLGLSNLVIRFNYVGTALSNWALDNVVVTNTISNPSGTNVYNPLYYTWSPTTDLSSPNTNTTTTTVTYTPTIGNGTGVKSYTVSAAVGSCVATTTSLAVNITVNGLPTITTTGIAAAVCFNAGAQTATMPYTATTNSPTSYSITWTGIANQGNTAFAFAAGGGTLTGIVIPAGTAAGTYTGTMTITNSNGCTKTQPVSVTVNALPTITTTGTAAAICFNAGVQNTTMPYTATTNSPTSYSITWTGIANQGNTVFAFAAGGGTLTGIVIPAGTPVGAYTGTMTVTNANGCTNTQAVSVTVNGLPTITTTGIAAAICFNTGAQTTTMPYTATTNSPTSYSIVWTGMANQGSTAFAFVAGGGTFTGIVIPAGTAAGTYTGTMTISNANTCIGTQAISVIINPTTVAGTLPSVSVCTSGTGTLNLLGSTGSVVRWESSLDNFATAGTIIANTTTSLIYTAAATTIYYRAYVQSGTCTAAYSNIATVGLHNVWTGFTSTDWNTASNWSDGLLPSISCPNVIITNVTNKPVLSSGTATINNLVINSGASLTVTGIGVTLQIAGTITNSNPAGVGFDVSNGSLDFNGLASQTISGDMFVGGNLKNLTVNNTVGLNVTASPANPLNIIGDLTFGASNGKLNTGDNVVLVSTATTTARVENITKNGTGNLISGKVTVQRYFPALRAWRLITSPLSNTGNIFSTWQNGGLPATTAPGKGTYVTGTVVGTGGGGNGLDNGPFLNPSLKTGSNLTDVNDTKIMMLSNSTGNADNIGYLMFVRGDRDPINTVVPYTNTTTLSSKGKLQTGTQTFNATGTLGAYTLIGNPYASPVDLGLVTLNNLENIFYVWDPRLSTVGGYVLMQGPAPFTFIPNNSPGIPTKDVQSSEAFFVRTSTTNPSTSIVFNESNKSSGNNLNMFRPMNPAPSQSLRTNLYMVNSDGNRHMADGNLAQFDDSYNPGVDLQDALKFGNVNETFGLLSGNTSLALDRRPPLANTDTVFFSFAKARQLKYQFEFTTELLERDNLAGFVEDKFLHKLSPLNMNGTNKLDFEVTAAAASAAIDRFRVVFKPSVVYTKLRAAVFSSDIGVEWNVASELDIKAYDVERSTDGINFTKMGTVTSVGNSTTAVTYSWLDKSPALGHYYYRIRSVSNSNVVGHSNIAKVKINKSTPAIYVFPNPVTENILQLQMNGMPQGVYGVRLMNSLGQAVVTNRISHTAGTATETIRPARKLIAGVYELQVTAPDKKITMVKVIVH